MASAARRLTTWCLITRACTHVEAVRVAGHYSRRRRIIDTLRADQCSPCVGWPTLPVDPEAIRHDLRAAGTYPEPVR